MCYRLKDRGEFVPASGAGDEMGTWLAAWFLPRNHVPFNCDAAGFLLVGPFVGGLVALAFVQLFGPNGANWTMLAMLPGFVFLAYPAGLVPALAALTTARICSRWGWASHLLPVLVGALVAYPFGDLFVGWEELANSEVPDAASSSFGAFAFFPVCAVSASLAALSVADTMQRPWRVVDWAVICLLMFVVMAILVVGIKGP